jgi:hypothetical protein
MNQRILFSILMVLFSQLAFGQFYAGVNTATLTTKGTEITTVLSSEQMVGRYLPEQNQLNFMIKTQTFGFNAGQTAQDYLNEVLLVQANPLLSINLNLEISNISESAETDISGVLSFNGQEMTFQTKAQVNKSAESIQLSTTLELDLNEVGIYVPNDHKTFSSSLVQLTIDQATLQKR